jgi:hypothetical protein
MPDLTSFNAENYRKTRAYLATMPAFNWWRGHQDSEGDEGCVACAVSRSCAGSDRGDHGRHVGDSQALGLHSA